jgi:hypothetical protein
MLSQSLSRWFRIWSVHFIKWSFQNLDHDELMINDLKYIFFGPSYSIYWLFFLPNNYRLCVKYHLNFQISSKLDDRMDIWTSENFLLSFQGRIHFFLNLPFTSLLPVCLYRFSYQNYRNRNKNFNLLCEVT